MRGKKGFTLIELMIVIAIIAIIAAIAIPGLLASQRASNERNASASLKTIGSAQADFRANDRDGNRIQDYWVADISGLYGVLPNESTEMIKLVEISVAGADAIPIGTAALAATGPDVVNNINYIVQAPKAGYWYAAIPNDAEGNPYAMDTQGIGWTSNDYFNHSRFAFMAFPDTRSAGRTCFYISEENTIFKRAVNEQYVRPGEGAIPPGELPDVVGLFGNTPSDKWPDDSELKADFAKID